MEKSLEIKTTKTEVKPEAETKSPIFQFVEKNFDQINKLLFSDIVIEELLDVLKNDTGYLGVIDKKNITSKIFSLKTNKKEILDKFIEDLKIEENGTGIPDNDDLLKIYDDIEYAKESTKEKGHNLNEKHVQEEENEEFEYGIDIDISKMIADRLAERKAEKHNIIDRDELRLKKIREIIAKSLKEKSKKHEFDSQKEFLKISDSEGKLPEKREILAEYKKNFKEQQLGMGEINSFLEKEVFKKKSLDINKLSAYLREQTKKYELAPWQIKRYKMVFDEVANTEVLADEFWKKNKNKPAAELLYAVPNIRFNLICEKLKLKGKIDVKKFPLAIAFYFHSKEDYVHINSHGEETAKYDMDNLATGEMFGRENDKDIPVIVINISELPSQKELRNTFDHEYKHVINDRIRKALGGMNIEEIEFNNLFNETIEDQFNRALKQGKDEVLSFIKGNTELFEIYLQLALEEQYDYFKDSIAEDEKTDELKEEITNKQDKFKNKYREIIMDGLVVIAELRIIGFNRQQAIGLLQAEKIENWGKVIKRMLYDGELIKKNIDAIRKNFSYCEKGEKEISKQFEKIKRHNFSKKLRSKEDLETEIMVSETELKLIKKIKDKLEKMLKQAEEN